MVRRCHDTAASLDKAGSRGLPGRRWWWLLLMLLGVLTAAACERQPPRASGPPTVPLGMAAETGDLAEVQRHVDAGTDTRPPAAGGGDPEEVEPMWWVRVILAVLAVACLVVWGLSYTWSFDATTPLPSPNRSLDLSVQAGRVRIGVHHNPPGGTGPVGAGVALLEPLREWCGSLRQFGHPMPTPDEQPWFAWDTLHIHYPPRIRHWSSTLIHFPLGLVALVLGVWPAVALVRWLRHRRRSGLCKGCGYDLRGSPSGDCPECGHAGTSAEARVARADTGRAR